MPDKSILWTYERIYEPVQGFDGSWIVNYKDFVSSAWKQSSFPDRESAYKFYFEKFKSYQTYYNVFLREQHNK